MYEDRAQNYDAEIHKKYLVHDTVPPATYNHIQTAAIKITNYTKRQQFSAVTISLKTGFLRF